MTQHIYPAVNKQGKEVRITVGWDRPLRELFAQVWFKGNDGPTFSTLADKFSTDQVVQLDSWLQCKGFKVPAPVLQGLEIDVRNNLGNNVTEYDAAGIVIPDNASN